MWPLAATFLMFGALSAQPLSATADGRTVRSIPKWERIVLGEACGTVVGFAFTVYRLPGLVDDDKQGHRAIARVKCALATVDAFETGRLIRVHGAAPSTLGRRARPWILVSLVRKPSIRGWMPLHLKITVESMDVPWRKVPLAKVEEPTLPAGLPDLHIAGFDPSARPGDRCQVPGSPVRVRWVVSVGNAGPGAGPRLIRAEMAGQTVAKGLSRSILPGERVALGQSPGDADVVVDPANEVVETDEGNNTMRLPPSPPDLRCGP